MFKYRVFFFNSGGYRDNEIISTPFEIIERDHRLVVIDNAREIGKEIGGAEMVEQMINDTRGWQEANTAVRVEKVSLDHPDES
ncbi:hypothetical protein ACFSJ3_00370 [Corallincola platygyrae]|uniref:Uncharacterized protein n=1 Tax=Corallincola platygyrae TaxID=1193278 RepID=A0ABW4XG11_9GAMM